MKTVRIILTVSSITFLVLLAMDTINPKILHGNNAVGHKYSAPTHGSMSFYVGYDGKIYPTEAAYKAAVK